MEEYKSLNLETGEETIKKVTSEELKEKEALLEKLKKEEKDAFDALSYDEKRQKEYPSWQDQLDKIYHSGLTAWKADIKAVKDKYPKP
jgi:FtsZ-binding cell division protein ZapB|tara:strand:+ start:316 stop:579 length:264 start_codon:yes stop_codon:yes gene_type:complete